MKQQLKRYASIIILLLVCISGSSTASGQSLGWKQMPSWMQSVNELQIGPNNTVGAIMNNLLLAVREPDGNWRPIVFDTASTAVPIALSMSSSGAILVTSSVSGIVRISEDHRSKQIVMSDIKPSAIVQSASGTYFAFIGGPQQPSTTIYRSSDDGYTWDYLSTISLPTFQYVVDKNDNCYLSLFNAGQVGVVRYSPANDQYTSLVQSNTSGSYSFCTIIKNEVLLRAPDGCYVLNKNDQWEKRGSLQYMYFDNNLPLGDHSGFVAAADGTLVTKDIQGSKVVVMRSKDGGRNWDPMPMPVDIPGQQVDLTIDSAGTIYIGVRSTTQFDWSFTLFSSTSDGATWEPVKLATTNLSMLSEGPDGKLLGFNYEFANQLSTGGFQVRSPYLTQGSYYTGELFEQTKKIYTALPQDWGVFTPATTGLNFFGIGYTSTYDLMTSSWFYDPVQLSFEVRNSYLDFAFPPVSSQVVADTTYHLIPHIIADQNDLVLTTDNGASWETIETPQTHTTLSAFTYGVDRLLYVGFAPSLYRTGNRGFTWERILTPVINSPITAIAVPNDATIIIGTGDKGIWRSTDHGVTWKKWSLLDDQFTTVEFKIVQNRCYAATNRGLYSAPLTSDHWDNELFADEQWPIEHLLIGSKGNIFVSARNFGVWTNDKTFSSVAPSIAPSSATLELIKAREPDEWQLQIPSQPDSKITIALYDLLGRMVLSIADRTVPASSLHFSTSSLPSGTYFIAITTATGRQLYKLVK